MQRSLWLRCGSCLARTEQAICRRGFRPEKHKRFLEKRSRQKTDPSAAAYTGNLTETDQENGMHSFQIVIRENGERGEELFTLDAKKYIRRQD